MIRVLRLIEYTYDDAEMAEKDMSRWNLPAVGIRRHGPNVVRSTILTDLNFEGMPEGYLAWVSTDADSSTSPSS